MNKDDILQKRPLILISLLMVATPYVAYLDGASIVPRIIHDKT